jgi:hypothetical protein
MSWPGEMYLDEVCLAVTASLRPLGIVPGSRANRRLSSAEHNFQLADDPGVSTSWFELTIL